MEQLVFQVGFVLVLLIVGFSFGRLRERRHLRDLDRRERETGDIVTTDLKEAPPGIDAAGGHLVMGDVVIASDYFKIFLANFRMLFGGEMRSFQTMLERARREAKLRMLEDARRQGARSVINVRFETSEIGSVGPMSEILCYGTAVLPPERVREARVG